MTYYSKSEKEFKINAYRLQYWLYAILNKEFGQEVKFHRDDLHRIYEVNRHGFEVGTNTQSIKKVKESLIQKLTEAGFKLDEKYPEFHTYEKINMRKTGVEKLYIHINEQSRGLGAFSSNKPVLLIQPSSYWKSHK